jgi:putative hydroxymethylpyrimidine transport system permease protein
VWFGYGIASKIITAMMMLFFPVTSNFYDGLRQTKTIWLDLAKTMNSSSWQTLWQIKIPAALPSLASGLRIAATIAPIGAIVGEWVGASRGLGYLMLNANARMQIDLMFAALITVTLLTILLYFSVDKILKKTITWA